MSYWSDSRLLKRTGPAPKSILNGTAILTRSLQYPGLTADKPTRVANSTASASLYSSLYVQ